MNDTAATTDHELRERYGKQQDMHIQTHVPVNMEAPLSALDHDITPLDHFFMRNNHEMPTVDAATWSLTIDGLVENLLTIDYQELCSLPTVRHVAFLECYGNGRTRFAESGQEAEGVPWRQGAIANAEWEGVPVALLLERTGISPHATQIECGSPGDFIRGVDLDVMQKDAFLAYRMNGQPIPAEHGGPVRLIVPGWGGINWVKWITAMTVIDHESHSTFNRDSYIIIDENGEYQGKTREIYIKSLINNIEPNSVLSAGSHEIHGMAWSAHGVQRVEVSTDGGETWHDAELATDLGQYSWRRFSYTWQACSGQHELVARATNQAGNVQPASVPYNRKGYLMNAYHRVAVSVE